MNNSGFRKLVMAHYEKEGRVLPWRKTRNPYRILVSEVMLQQTQAERVKEHYRRFLKRYPTLKSLREAPLSDVLREWQGLGYNRRAKMLHSLANETKSIPRDLEELMGLPGVGAYTASAIMNFAYEKATPMIETNIRTAYIHSFFKNKESVTDREILQKVQETLDRDDPKTWFNALMDYGAHLKKEGKGMNSRSSHYKKQNTFKGSRRELRGIIIKELSNHAYKNTQYFIARSGRKKDEVASVLEDLLKEGLIRRVKNTYALS